PSGSDLATEAKPMLPPAPGRISMITGCPSRRETSSSTTRLTVSEALPAGEGLITFIGLLGPCCAFAAAAPTIKIVGTTRRRTIRKIFPVAFLASAVMFWSATFSAWVLEMRLLHLQVQRCNDRRPFLLLSGDMIGKHLRRAAARLRSELGECI